MQEGEHDTYLQLFKWGKGDLWLLKEAHGWTDGLNTKGQRFHLPFHLKVAIILREPQRAAVWVRGKRVTVWVNTSPCFSFQSAVPSPTEARPIWICLKVPVQQNLMLLLLNSDCDQRWLAHRRTRTGAIWSVWGLFLEWMPVEQSGSLGVFLFYASNKTKELGMNNPSGRHLPGYF